MRSEVHTHAETSSLSRGFPVSMRARVVWMCCGAKDVFHVLRKAKMGIVCIVSTFPKVPCDVMARLGICRDQLAAPCKPEEHLIIVAMLGLLGFRWGWKLVLCPWRGGMAWILPCCYVVRLGSRCYSGRFLTVQCRCASWRMPTSS